MAAVRDSLRNGESETRGDDELLVEIAGGDKQAIGTLYDRYASLLLGLARRILGDNRESEDLVHDVFLEVWRHASDFDGTRGSVRSWICMRLRSRALDRKKAPRLTRAVVLDEPARDRDQEMPHEDPTLAPDRTRVRDAVAALPSDQRIVLELGYYEGLSSTEIAERISCPLGTVKSRVAAALARLRAGMLTPPAIDVAATATTATRPSSRMS